MSVAHPATAETATGALRIVRHAVVRNRLGVSPAKLFDMCARGQFPKPFVIIPGGRAVGWLEDDVNAWIRARKAEGGAR
jgi:prophage regulatory protein